MANSPWAEQGLWVVMAATGSRQRLGSVLQVCESAGGISVAEASFLLWPKWCR